MSEGKALEYLRRKEWSMGNGQCPECYGAHEGWLGHPCHIDGKNIGHKPDCIMAAALWEMGGNPLMVGVSAPILEDIKPAYEELEAAFRAARKAMFTIAHAYTTEDSRTLYQEYNSEISAMLPPAFALATAARQG